MPENHLLGLANAYRTLQKTFGWEPPDPKEQLQLENLRLENLKLRKNLAEPTWMQKKQIEETLRRKVEERKAVFDMWQKIGTDPNTSQAARDHALRFSENYWNILEPGEQSAMMSYYKWSPINPVAQKIRQYKEVFGEPKAPETDEPQAVAEYVFQRAEYNREMKKFAGLTPEDVPELIPIGEGLWAKKDQRGMVTTWNENDETLKELAAAHNTTAKALIMSDMRIFGKPQTIQFGPYTFVMRTDELLGMHDEDANVISLSEGLQIAAEERGISVEELLKKQAEGEEIGVPRRFSRYIEGPIGKDPSKPDIPSEFGTFLKAALGNDTSGKTEGSRMYQNFKSIMDDLGAEGANSWLETLGRGTGWRYKVNPASLKNKAWTSFLGSQDWDWNAEYIAKTGEGYISAWKPERTEVFPDKNGINALLDIDADDNVYVPNTGQYLGKLHSVRARLATGDLDWSVE